MQPAVCHMPYNRAMSHLDILIPFGLPPAELAADLYKELNAPALGMLAARARSEHETAEDYSRSLPHESWLARRFGAEEELKQRGSPPVAADLMKRYGIPVDEGLWFIVQPVHIHIARDHLVLTDPRQLQLSDKESLTLFDMAKPLFAETGRDLRYGNSGYWFLRADDWADLQTSTPDAAAGHNIDIWMPKGLGERDWRKVQNEVQMHWFTHPLNAQRELHGRKPVNSLWLWGAEDASASNAQPPYSRAVNLGDWLQAFAQRVSAHTSATSAKQTSLRELGETLIVLDQLLEPALTHQWAEWLDRMRALEANWMAPLQDALKSGTIDSLSLIITDQTRLSRFTATRSSLRKFWVKPSLAALCP